MYSAVERYWTYSSQFSLSYQRTVADGVYIHYHQVYLIVIIRLNSRNDSLGISCFCVECELTTFSFLVITILLINFSFCSSCTILSSKGRMTLLIASESLTSGICRFDAFCSSMLSSMIREIPDLFLKLVLSIIRLNCQVKSIICDFIFPLGLLI